MSQCRDNKSDRGPSDLPNHTHAHAHAQVAHPEGCWEPQVSPQSMDLMYLIRSTPTRQGMKRPEKESFELSTLHRCVTSVAVLPGDFPPQSSLRRADIVCLGPWSHHFQEFGHNCRLVICNICHCSVVMQQSPSAHGPISLQ